MTEMLAPRQQDSEPTEDTLVEDREKAHAMAIASNRNELNRVAFKQLH